MEVSDTASFDRPVNGRAWFEAAIRDHLDLGHPQEVSLIVDRKVNRRTPGRFETRVVRHDVDPEIRIRYKSDKVKAYFKEQRALRVDTTINNPDDFGVRRRLRADNWDACATSARRQTNAFSPRSAKAKALRLTRPRYKQWSCRRLHKTASEQPVCASEIRG